MHIPLLTRIKCYYIIANLSGFVFDEASISSLVSEIVKMKDFSHLNVLTLMGVALDNRNNPCLVMPYMSNGSLVEYLRRDSVREELLWTKHTEVEILVSCCLFVCVCVCVCSHISVGGSAGVCIVLATPKSLS